MRLNVESTTELAKNPSASPRELAEHWAAEEFGSKAASKIADMLMLSSDCVRKCVYIGPYARDHKGWMPSRNLMRDDIIRGERVLRENGGIKILYDGSKQALAEALDPALVARLAAQARAQGRVAVGPRWVAAAADQAVPGGGVGGGDG